MSNGYGPPQPATPPGTVVVAEYSPPPTVAREALARRIQEAWRRAGHLTEAATTTQGEGYYLKGVILAQAINDTGHQLAMLLERGADDREFVAPMQRLAELESGLEALGL